MASAEPSRETNQGLTESSFWLKFEIHNASMRAIDRYITIGNEVPYDIQFWLRRNGQTLQHYQGGSRVEFDSRILKTSLEGILTRLTPDESLPFTSESQIFVPPISRYGSWNLTRS